jgi:hypothetical protein
MGWWECPAAFVVPALDGAGAGRLGVGIRRFQDVGANRAYGCAAGERALRAQPHLRPGIATRPRASRPRPQRCQVRAHRALPSSGQTPIRPPHRRQRHHHVTTTPLRQKRDRRMPLTQPHLNAIPKPDAPRPATRTINTDRTNRLLGRHLTSLIQRRKVGRRHRQRVCQPKRPIGVSKRNTTVPNTKRHSPPPPTGTTPWPAALSAPPIHLSSQ